MTNFKNFIAELKKFAEQFASKNNVKKTEIKMTWSSSSDDENDVIEVNEDEKTLRRFKKTENFDELNAVVKERNDCKNTKYESDEERAQDKNKEMKNFIVLDD